MFIDLFKTGVIDYSDLGFDKPVKFTDEVLSNLNLDTVPLTREHSSEKLGVLSNFVVENGILKVEKPDLELEGLGLSPVFEGDFVDKGDYLEPSSLFLKEVGLVSNPRTGIIYNSGDNVSDNLRELLDRKDEIVTEQQEEIALLKKQVDELTKVANDKNKVEDELKVKLKDLEKASSMLEEYKTDALRLREQEAKIKDDLIMEIAGDDEKSKQILSNHSVEDLEYMKEKTIITEPVKGVDSNLATGEDVDGDLDTASEDEEYKYSYEAFDKWDIENSR